MDENIELKTPSQALKLLKEDLKCHTGFKRLIGQGFINKPRFFAAAYDIIKDNFKQTTKVFILKEQVNILINNEVQLNLSSAMEILTNNDLLDITAVDPEGQLLYRLSDKGIKVIEQLKALDGKKKEDTGNI